MWIRCGHGCPEHAGTSSEVAGTKVTKSNDINEATNVVMDVQGPITTADFLAIIRMGVEPIADDIRDLRSALATQITDLRDRDEAARRRITRLETQTEDLIGSLSDVRELLTAIVGSLDIEKFRSQIVDITESFAETEELAKLEKRVVAVETIVPAVKIMIWVGSILGASVVALIWALIIGRASISW